MIPVAQGIPTAAIVCASLLLAACGGGGGDGPPASARLNEPSCAQPYFLTDPRPPASGADPLLPAQWHLTNAHHSGGTPGEDPHVGHAWQPVDGAGVRVAVIDSGIEVTHEDRQPNLVAGASFNYRPGTHTGSAYPLPCAA